MEVSDYFVGVFPLKVNRVPFSFRYGRKHSAQLLHHWDTESNGQFSTWTDPTTGLRVRADTRIYSTGATEWVLTFTNTGSEPTPILEDVQVCKTKIEGDMGWRKDALLHRLNGSSCREDDWLPYTTEIKPGTWERWGPQGGRSSSGTCPFFAVQWNDGGVITAIGWTGQWKAQLIWGTMTEIRVGMEHMHLSLLPGESIRTPSIMQLWWEGAEVPYNLFRKTMIDHVLPRIDGELVVPPIAHLSTVAWEWNSSSERTVLEHLESIEGLGFETFWLDAYYMDGFPASVGNYRFPVTSVVAEDRYPRGLGYIGDRVHAAGMDWLVWYEPERVAKGTYLDQDHPEWLLSAPGQEGKLFNLGLLEAREYMTRYLTETVQEHKMDWLRIDCNIDHLPYWREADAKNPSRAGITEIRHVEGLYRMLDDILEACPQLKIDNCASGGRRIDLEMCKRTTPLWRTDYSLPIQERTGDFDWGAVVNQAHIAGLNRYVPLHGCGAIFEKPYWFRSAFNAGIDFADDCRDEYYPRDVLETAIEEGKRIRKYFLGNFHPLTEVTLDPTTWHVVQYHRPDEGDGIVLAFRRHESPYSNFACSLREIDPGSEYTVSWFYDYTLDGRQCTMPGTQLQYLSFRVTDCPGSVLVEYRKT